MKLRHIYESLHEYLLPLINSDIDFGIYIERHRVIIKNSNGNVSHFICISNGRILVGPCSGTIGSSLHFDLCDPLCFKLAVDKVLDLHRVSLVDSVKHMSSEILEYGKL